MNKLGLSDDCNGDGWPDDPPVSAADCYRTRNNRLMSYVTFDSTVPPGYGYWEQVQYQYAVDRAAVGNPTYIVRKVYDPEHPTYPDLRHFGYTLQYNGQGELWFITQQTWTNTRGVPAWPVTVSCHEFRGSGRADLLPKT